MLVCTVVSDITPPPPAPAPHRSLTEEHSSYDVEAAIKDIRLTLQRTKILPLKSSTGGEECEENTASPIWVPRYFLQNALYKTMINCVYMYLCRL